MRTSKQKNTIDAKERYAPQDAKERDLVRAFALIRNEEDAAAFLRDLMTVAEIQEFSNRLQIARSLLEGKPYLQIAHESKTSTTTVTRVAHWLFSGCGGYASILKKLKRKYG